MIGGLFASTEAERKWFAAVRRKPLSNKRTKPHLFRINRRWRVITATKAEGYLG